MYYGSVIIHHCEGNSQIFSGISKSPDRLCKFLREQARHYTQDQYCYPYDDITLDLEDLRNPGSGFKMPIVLDETGWVSDPSPIDVDDLQLFSRLIMAGHGGTKAITYPDGDFQIWFPPEIEE